MAHVKFARDGLQFIPAAVTILLLQGGREALKDLEKFSMVLGDIEIIGRPVFARTAPEVEVVVEIIEPIDRLTKPVMHRETFRIICNRDQQSKHDHLSNEMREKTVKAFTEGVNTRVQMMETFLQLVKSWTLEMGGSWPGEMLETGNAQR